VFIEELIKQGIETDSDLDRLCIILKFWSAVEKF